MYLKRFGLLIRMEWMKTCCRLNIVFLCLAFALVLIQVAFLVRLDLGAAPGLLSAGESLNSAMVNSFASRYIDNLAFTFIPILLLVNIGREFEYAIVQRSLVSGVSRPGYFNGKMIQLGLFSLFALVLAIAFQLLIPVIYEVEIVLDFKKLVMYFIVTVCLGSLALMIAFILRKRFYALTVFVAYIILENTLTTITPGKSLPLPYQTCIRLLRHSIYGYPEFIMAGTYTFIFLAIAFRLFKRSDLK